MDDTPVILGGIAFQDFEIPNRISFGGKQVHKIHDEFGGTRIVDAVGPTPGDKTWSGRFRGADAIPRAQAIDALRIAGAQVSLSWFGLLYQVLIVEFTATTEKFYEVPYSITCVVIDDPAQDSLAAAASTLDMLVSGDLASLQSIL